MINDQALDALFRTRAPPTAFSTARSAIRSCARCST